MSINLKDTNIFKIYEILADFFGEDNVELNYGNELYDEGTSLPIVIRFPEIKVENEINQFVYIQNLFAKLDFDTPEGKLINDYESLTLLRTSFPFEQYKVGYSHSHLPRYDVTWRVPCFGRGPIKATLTNLTHRQFDELNWMLFCKELDDYVHTESLQGGPWIAMSNITDTNHYIYSTQPDLKTLAIIPNYSAFVKYTRGTFLFGFIDSIQDSIPDFKIRLYKVIIRTIKTLFKNNSIPFVYKIRQYDAALSWQDCILKINNVFLLHFNKEFYNIDTNLKTIAFKPLFVKVVYKDGVLYTTILNSHTTHWNVELGSTLIYFKNTDYKFEIISTEQEQTDSTILLVDRLIMNYIYHCMINLYNLVNIN